MGAQAISPEVHETFLVLIPSERSMQCPTSVALLTLFVGQCNAAYQLSDCVINYYKLKSTQTNNCSGSSSSQECGISDCCEADTTKCGGSSFSCNSTYWYDGNTVGTTAAACCTVQRAACTSSSPCMDGYKVRSTLTNRYCLGATCSTLNSGSCCELDTTKCGGNTNLCNSSE